MFSREIKLNQFMLGYFDKVVADIPAESFAERGIGGGHPPQWIVGHLAVVGETALQLAGGPPPAHPEWGPLFGPRSSDEPSPGTIFGKDELTIAMRQSYEQLQQQVATLSEEAINRPHPLALLRGTPIETVGDLLAHVLTCHFTMHAAQLSCWRRAAGKPHLF